MGVFEVEIGPSATAGTFAVQVVNSAAGEATETVALDLDGLLGRRQQFQQALLMSSLRSRRLVDTNEDVIQQAGQGLFDALLGRGEVAGLYRSGAALAASSGEGLRVVLRIEDPRLAGLPWEAMYDAKHGRYICRGEQLVRHVPVAQVTAPLTVRPPLRVLVIAASPRGLPELNVAKEKDQLTRALHRLVADGLVDLHWVDQAPWSHLHHLLLSGTWHVVHFIGHGDFDDRRDTGLLALVGEDGYANKVSADRFVDLLRQARPMPRLVLLNSCSGAAGGQLDLFAGTAAALVRGGVTAVAAMQFEITDAAAIAFSRGFYEAIAYDRGVDDAVSSGRTAILGLSDQTLEWVTPVLYLRGSQTQLFTLTAPDPSGARTTARIADELILDEPTGGTAQTEVTHEPRPRPGDDAHPGADPAETPTSVQEGTSPITVTGGDLTIEEPAPRSAAVPLRATRYSIAWALLPLLSLGLLMPIPFIHAALRLRTWTAAATAAVYTVAASILWIWLVIIFWMSAKMSEEEYAGWSNTTNSLDIAAILVLFSAVPAATTHGFLLRRRRLKESPGSRH